jgi:hypothetical protein
VSDHVLGSKGRAELMKHVITTPEKQWVYEGDPKSMYKVEHDELFAGIRSGKPINDGVSAAKSTLMAVMGRMATYTGQRVTWDFAMNKSKDQLLPPAYEWTSLPAELSTISVPGEAKLV